MKKVFLLFLMFFVLLSINQAYGFGIASDYYPGNPLIMAPGETKEIVFGRLQNMLNDSEDMNVSAELISGSEIANLTDSDLQYSVPFGTKNVSVGMKIKIPAEAVNGTEYSVAVKFTEIPRTKKEGMVFFAQANTKSIKVLIIEPTRAETTNDLIWVIAGFVVLSGLVIAVYFLIKNKFSFEGTKDEDLLK